MADQTKDDAATKAARAEAESRARAGNLPATAAPPAAATQSVPVDTVQSLTEAVRNLEARTRLPGPAAATANLDATVPGGKIIDTKGRLVNAHGREIHEDGTLIHPEQQQVDQYGRLV